MISLPLAFFGVNEVLLFCLPIILNPRLLVPFLSAPVVLTFASVSVLQFGLIPFDPQLSLPNAPVLVNAWLVSGGHLGGPLLQLSCLLLSTLIYLPFVNRIAQRNEPHEIEISQLNASFVSNVEANSALEDDPVSKIQNAREQAIRLERSFGYIKDLTFELHYQPKVDPRSNIIVGAEALIRAREPSGKLVFPNAFLPSFVEAKMARELDLWVAQSVIEQLERWAPVSAWDCPISINISAESLADRKTVDALIERLAPWAARLRIELTEETLASTEPEIDTSISRLKECGIRLDIDDFGTGYSSMSYLNRFDPDAIKIDRSFVLELVSPRGAALFHSLIKFAQSLELEVVVEGLESAEQLAHLERYDNVSVQGWYYAKAMPPEALMEYIARCGMTERTGDR